MTLRRSLIAALCAWAAVVGLAGCSGTRPSAHTDDLRSQQGESGITVFGDIDVGVGKQHTR